MALRVSPFILLPGLINNSLHLWLKTSQSNNAFKILQDGKAHGILSYKVGGMIQRQWLKYWGEVLQPQNEQTFVAETQPGLMREAEYVVKLFITMLQLYWSEGVSLLTLPSPNLKKLSSLKELCPKMKGCGVRILAKKRLVIQYSSTISNDKQTDDLFAYLIS